MMPPSNWWYPLEPSPRRYTEVECAECGWVWYAEGRYEDGRWVPEREEDLECPVCLERIDA